jgi:phenylalanyl-tRNA synthetase beta chain
LDAFLGKEDLPRYRLVYPPGGEKDLITVIVSPEVCLHFASLPLTTFSIIDPTYTSLLRLCSIAQSQVTLTPPFRYEARTPTNISFVPLGRETVHNAAELLQIFESDKHLSRYLHITRNSDVYPIIYNAEDHVLSMPSIINSTAMDDTKLQIVVNMVATMFSEYCAESFTYATFVLHL